MRTSSRNKSGFTLTEVAIALALASFCLSSLVCLIPVGLQANQAAIGQTFTNGIVSSVVADLRGTPNTAATSLQYSIPIPINPVKTASTYTLFFPSDASTFTTTPNANSLYMVVVTFESNGTSTASDDTSIFANVSISWPITSGANAATKAPNTYQTFIGLDRS